MTKLKKKPKFCWKSYRLKRFQKVIKLGKRIINFNLPQFSFYVAKNNTLSHCQFGIGVPRKMIKGATERNFYKRQVKNILIRWIKKTNHCHPQHTHQSLIIIVRYPYLKNDFATNQKNLEWLLEWVLKKNSKINNQWGPKNKSESSLT